MVVNCGRVMERSFCVAVVVRRSDGKSRDVVHSVRDGVVMCKNTSRVVDEVLFVDGSWGVGVGWNVDRDVGEGRILVMTTSMLRTWNVDGGMSNCVPEV